MRSGAWAALALPTALLLACGGGTTVPEHEPGPGEGVLFIGNSLTGQNDLPGMVGALAAAAGVSFSTAAVVRPGASLEDLWREGAAAIARGGWSAVVVQQGPSTLPASREHLVHWAGVYADAARAVGAKPYLYMVWPPRDGDWVRGIESYRRAAEAAGGGLLPVAEAFRAAWRRDPELRLLALDDFHPTALGTYLAAVVIVAQLEGRTPVGLPRELPGYITVAEDVALLLHEAAEDAIAAETARR